MNNRPPFRPFYGRTMTTDKNAVSGEVRPRRAVKTPLLVMTPHSQPPETERACRAVMEAKEHPSEKSVIECVGVHFFFIDRKKERML